jgi:hypothetical protein
VNAASGSTPVAVLRGVHARVTRLVDALDVGDLEFMRIALDDLAADLWSMVEAEQKRAAA